MLLQLLVIFYCIATCQATFPTMLLLHKAQWPFVVVRTPIFSRSELRPPSRSSMASFFLLTVPETVLALLSLAPRSSSASAGFVLFTDCFFLSGGTSDGTESCKKKIIVYSWFCFHYYVLARFSAFFFTKKYRTLLFCSRRNAAICCTSVVSCARAQVSVTQGLYSKSSLKILLFFFQVCTLTLSI